MPVRATVTAFGPTLLSKVLGLNEVQESSLGLVFHYADKNGLLLLDLEDLRSVVKHLVSDDGKAELKDLGGLSAATAGVILRELVAFSDQGADVFFGEPELDTADLLRTTADDKGVVTCLELPSVQDRPQLWLALVFNVLIGNCDAHGKNFSLLYDTGAPTLAPLYDLVSTTEYPELTTRLAMRIDGAVNIEEVGLDSWVRLADEIGVSERFARRTTTAVADRVRAVMRTVGTRSDQRGELPRRIRERIRSLARPSPYGL